MLRCMLHSTSLAGTCMQHYRYCIDLELPYVRVRVHWPSGPAQRRSRIFGIIRCEKQNLRKKVD